VYLPYSCPARCGAGQLVEKLLLLFAFGRLINFWFEQPISDFWLFDWFEFFDPVQSERIFIIKCVTEYLDCFARVADKANCPEIVFLWIILIGWDNIFDLYSCHMSMNSDSIFIGEIASSSPPLCRCICSAHTTPHTARWPVKPEERSVV
jgi:hypothetical protein